MILTSHPILEKKRGYLLYIAEYIGHAMTFKILTEGIHNIIYRSNIRIVDDPNTPNLRLDLFDGEEPITKFIKSELDSNQDQTMIIMTPEYMIGRTFLGQPKDDGGRH